MGEPTFPEQARELKELLAQSHLSEDELARAAHLKEETFRKYLGGYQRCGAAKMQAIRLVVQLRSERMERAVKEVPAELHDDAVAYASKLLELTPEKRDLAKRLIDQLHGDPPKSKSNPGEKAVSSGGVVAHGLDIFGKALKVVVPAHDPHSGGGKRNVPGGKQAGESQSEKEPKLHGRERIQGEGT